MINSDFFVAGIVQSTYPLGLLKNNVLIRLEQKLYDA